MRRQRGASGVLIAVILILVTLLILALSALTRTTDANQQREQGLASLAKAAGALESYVSASQRLPCPADGTKVPTDPLEGVELTNGAAGCQVPDGTVPWKTIGMRRDDAFDAWGRKISYRVYTGPAGSLTQPGGASMANCDTLEAFPGGVETLGTGVGLCRPDPSIATSAQMADPASRTTTPAQFLAGKGLPLTDMGTAHSDVAYVLISHGITGLGGYTASGTRLDMPNSNEEKNNTNATGPFTIQAFSNTDTGATDNKHFDDLLVYRSVAELAQRANLAARNWPDTILSSVVFDKATLAAALGSNPGNDTGQSTIAFDNGTVSVSAFDSGGAQDISYVHGGGSSDAIGGVSGVDGLLSSTGGEGVRIDFAEDARQFAFTVDQFNDSASLHEGVELRFLEVAGNTTTLKGRVIKRSCAANGKVTSFSVDACAAFNRVEVRPITMTDGSTPSSFSLAEIRSCAPSVVCETILQPTGNVCSTKAFTPCSIGINDTSVLTITLANPNGSDMIGAGFTDAYPAGVVNTAAGANTCGGTVTASGGGTSVALAGGTIPANGSCTVTVNVTTATPSAYNNTTSDVTTANAGTLAAVSGTLTALNHPSVAKIFNPAAVSQNSPSILTLTLTNTNATAITGVAFTDIYPTGLVNAATPGASTTCGGAVATDNSNPSPHVALSGGTIPAGGSCTVNVSVTSTSIGTYTNTLAAGMVTSDNAGLNTSSASASLTVN